MVTMHLTIVLLCIALFTVTNSLTDEEKKAIHEQCFTQTGVDGEIFAKAMDGEFVDDQNLKLYTLCFAKKVGLINDSGEIQKDLMRAKISSIFPDMAEVEEMMTKCVVQKGTPEDTTFEISKCIHGKKS